MNGDEAAFPSGAPMYKRTEHENGAYNIVAVAGGLTKREYFAGLAMQGILANPAPWGIDETISRAAVAHADLMLAELAKPREE